MSTQAPPRTSPRIAVATSPDYRARYRRRARRSSLIVAALWGSGALAALLSLANGWHASTAAEIVTGLGIVTGLVGTDLVLVMLVLAARIPLLDRSIGHDRAIAVHRSLGKPALYLLLAHGAMLTVGYALSAGIDPVAEVVSLWQTPDLPLAFIGLGLLITVVVSSVVAVRRRLSYEGWHVIHLLSYAAVLVAVPHQLSAGAILSEGTMQRAYWISLYVLAFGAIVTHRIVEPVVASVRHSLRVSSVDAIAPGVVSIELTGRRLRQLDAAGGQFFVWRFWSAGTWWHSHPISLSASPTDATLRITVHNLGAGSASLATVRPGTRAWFEGPYGLFSQAARTSPRLAIIAAGIGITPVRALLEHATLAPGEATVLLRASTPDETYLWRETIDIARQKGAVVYTMVGRRAVEGRRWMPQADADRGVSIASIVPSLRDTDLYICGPTPWLDLVVSDAVAAGIPRQQLHTERFDW